MKKIVSLILLLSILPLPWGDVAAALRAEREVYFKGKSVDGASYGWEFPGGVRKSGQRVKFAFPKPGTYPVTLMVRKGKRTGSITKRITVGKPGEPIIRNLNISQNEISADDPTVTVTAKATNSDPDSEVDKYTFYVLENGKVILSRVIKKEDIPEGKKAAAMFDLWQFPGKHTYYLKVEAIDEYGKKTSKISDEPIVVRSTAGNRRPTGMIMGNTAGTTNDTMFFHAQFRDSEGDALNYKWFVGEEMIGTQSTVSHQFKNPGKQIVKVQVEDGISARFVTNNPVEVVRQVNIAGVPYIDAGTPKENQPPTVSIKAIVPGTGGNTDTQFAFYIEANDPDGDSLFYEWDFGDGSKASLQNVAYKYEAPGEYPVKIQVSDGKLFTEETVMIQVVDLDETVPPSTLENAVEIEEENLHSSPLENDQLQIVSEEESPEEKIQKLIEAEEAALEEITDPAEKDRLKNKILQMKKEQEKMQEMERKETDLCEPPIFLNPNFLRRQLVFLQERKQVSVSTELDETKNVALNKEMEALNQNIGFVLNDRDAMDTEKLETQLVEILDTNIELGETDKKRIEAQIARFAECTEIKANNVDIIGTPNTNFFFYAKLLAKTMKAILFEWELGDGRKKMGQNARARYPEPGIYEVKLRVSDGLTEATDSITIKIIED